MKMVIYLSISNKTLDGIRDRIFFALESEEISQKEFSALLGISPQTITDWKKGKSHSYYQKLPLIADALNVNLNWLVDGMGEKSPPQKSHQATDHLIGVAYETRFVKFDGSRIKFSDGIPSQVPDTSSSSHRIPVLGTIPAGIPLEAIEDILDWEEVPAAWGSGDRQYFGLRVRGDSMYPRYLEGDTVILRKETTCESGDDCAVLVNGDVATLKQVMIRGDGSLELRPTNPAYPPRIYSPAEIESLPVQIIGVVVELRRKIK
ncbi:helix-turn-helix domain-containing protein [Pseudoflavonifractor phocaeensis]|uniref:helix-turn-helix domain-containing protein n=1 Tax=Pseudoflavonifractor phocaeensis TaxID=1870988 RepID=UPI001957D588|nr:XRE family transcriptional regulator [Pseudoflavonifractor phocaeensis]MBM6722236.1 helix-turn-helix domain-containing protein [Pseudoflavonifractor phocaeensis]